MSASFRWIDKGGIISHLRAYLTMLMCVLCVSKAQQMTMQAMAIQQQMLSSFPPVAPAPKTPPLQHHTHTPQHSHTTGPVSKHSYTVLSRYMDSCTPASMQRNQQYGPTTKCSPICITFCIVPVFLQTKYGEKSPVPLAAQQKMSMF